MDDRWNLEDKSQIGDVLLSRPALSCIEWPVIGALIELFQRGRYSHVIIKIGKDRWFSMQPPKPKVLTSADIAEDYREILVRRPIVAGKLSISQIENMNAIADKFLRLGEYDEAEIFGRAAAIILGAREPIFQERGGWLKAVCSGSVSHILIGAPLPDPCPDRSNEMTTPRDLARSPTLQTVEHGYQAGDGLWATA